MVYGTASGGGYDKKSAAIGAAAAKIKRDEWAKDDLLLDPFQAAIAAGAKSGQIANMLETAGFKWIRVI